MTLRFVCVHGHFYQPPRENPWLGKIERQPSARPYHDWNERITAECYAPNAAARILDERGELRRTINNYARMSFNFGPTLHDYLQRHAPETDRAIRDADRESREAHGGHGSALAQAYNHMILPLANLRDKQCQVRWGIADFERRFGRRPEGMWLPETAVDVETLEVLAQAGLRFTILAPHQARRVRLAGREWHEVDADTLDTTIAYEQRLPSGRSIALFFYHGPLAKELAFGSLLEDGKVFADRLAAIVPLETGRPGLAHVAADGETYGHHRKFGEMALAYALDRLENDPTIRLTNYSEFLANHPAEALVEIAPETSWSCAHGLERWRADCGCGSEGHAGWNQSWRAPLREALDWLRDRLAILYDEREGRQQTRRLLEMQRYAQLMYTSCGWFFDDLARIETIQVLRYAGRAVELAREISGDDPESEFLDRLQAARSNREEAGNGRDLYERHVIRRSR